MEYHTDLISLELTQCFTVTVKEVHSLKQNLSSFFHVLPAQKPCDCQRTHRFSGAGFSYQSNDLPLMQGKVKIVDHSLRSLMVKKLYIQICNSYHFLTHF